MVLFWNSSWGAIFPWVLGFRGRKSTGNYKILINLKCKKVVNYLVAVSAGAFEHEGFAELGFDFLFVVLDEFLLLIQSHELFFLGLHAIKTFNHTLRNQCTLFQNGLLSSETLDCPNNLALPEKNSGRSWIWWKPHGLYDFGSFGRRLGSIFFFCLRYLLNIL